MSNTPTPESLSQARRIEAQSPGSLYRIIHEQADEIHRLHAAEQAARDYIAEITNDEIGSGDDPVGFLVASHRVLRAAQRGA